MKIFPILFHLTPFMVAQIEGSAEQIPPFMVVFGQDADIVFLDGLCGPGSGHAAAGNGGEDTRARNGMGMAGRIPCQKYCRKRFFKGCGGDEAAGGPKGCSFDFADFF
jgi:hypothetical protein